MVQFKSHVLRKTSPRTLQWVSQPFLPFATRDSKQLVPLSTNHHQLCSQDSSGAFLSVPRHWAPQDWSAELPRSLSSLRLITTIKGCFPNLMADDKPVNFDNAPRNWQRNAAFQHYFGETHKTNITLNVQMWKSPISKKKIEEVCNPLGNNSKRSQPHICSNSLTQCFSFS